MKAYTSVAAQDAQKAGLSESYCQYLDESAAEHQAYYLRQGNENMANQMLTRSLGEALRGNDGI